MFKRKWQPFENVLKTKTILPFTNFGLGGGGGGGRDRSVELVLKEIGKEEGIGFEQPDG